MKSSDKKSKRLHSKKEGAFYDYSHVMRYIEAKYEINSRDLAGKFNQKPFDKDIPYLSFWQWIIKNYDPYRGSFREIQLITKVNYVMADEKYPVWAQEVLKKIADEFQPEGGIIKFWFDW